MVGSFPDGQSALMLVAARLRHIAGTKWGTKRYMDMNRLQEAGAAVEVPTAACLPEMKKPSESYGGAASPVCREQTKPRNQNNQQPKNQNSPVTFLRHSTESAKESGHYPVKKCCLTPNSRKGRILDSSQSRELRRTGSALFQLIQQQLPAFHRHSHPPTPILLQNLCSQYRRCHRHPCSDPGNGFGRTFTFFGYTLFRAANSISSRSVSSQAPSMSVGYPILRISSSHKQCGYCTQ